MRVFVYILLSSFTFLPHFIGADDPNLVDLSDIKFGVKSLDGRYMIEVTTKMRAKIRNCTTCTRISDTAAFCEDNRLVGMETEFIENDKRILIPFNISCGTENKDTNQFVISKVFASTYPHNIRISWESPNDKIRNYLWYCIDSNGRYTSGIKGTGLSLNVKGMKEKSWYQICIATIDDRWQTGKFVCQRNLTDFLKTGPITNRVETSETDRIFVSWSRPEYRYDIPQGYIVVISGPSNWCKIFIIKLEDVDVTVDDSCPDQQTLRWSALKTLEVTGLDVFAKFHIRIIPVNRKKPSAKTYFAIVTQEGESDAVRELIIREGSPGFLYIEFQKPSKPRGTIIDYKLKIRLSKTNICKKEGNALVYSASFMKLNVYISKDVLKKCGSYLAEVFPVNGWDRNEGIGKRASTTFDYKINTFSAPTVEARFISSMFLKVIVKNIQRDPNCETFGFFIEIRNELDHTNCFARMITNVDCDELEYAIRNISQCPNITQSQFKEQVNTLDVIFYGSFQNLTSYRIKVWLITDKLEEVSSQIILYEDLQDCFTDCFNPGEPYLGIQSMTESGEICIPWNNSTKSRICVMDNISKRPWCRIPKDSFEYCNVPKCSAVNSGIGCVAVNYKDISALSAMIKWTAPNYMGEIIGYIITLYNTNKECIRYQIQMSNHTASEISLDNRIKGFYISCASGQKTVGISNEVSFADLHQNRKYFVYIIPIVNMSTIGEVKTITIETVSARPDVPKNIVTNPVSLNAIDISWDKPEETQQFGIPSDYDVKTINLVTKEIRQKEVFNTKSNETDLKMCSMYCFTIMGHNNAGFSEYSKWICTSTLAPRPAKVVLEDLTFQYPSSQIVNWKYPESDNCQMMFLVEYRIKYLKYPTSIRTDKSSYKLTSLRRNVIYSVKVRGESLMETGKNERNGDFSDEKEFYTGFATPSIRNYTQIFQKSNNSLNIFWELHGDIKGAIFEYIVKIKDLSEKCRFMIRLVCDDCEDPLNYKNIPDNQQQKYNETLSCATLQRKSFGINDMAFSYDITLPKNLTGFAVDVYGINMMGVHNVRKSPKTEEYITDYLMKMVMIIVPIAVVVLFLLILLLVFIRQRKRRNIEHQNDLTVTLIKNPELIEIQETTPSKSGGFSNHEVPSMKAKAISQNRFFAYYEQVSLNGSAMIIEEYEKLSLEAKAFESSLGLTFKESSSSVISKRNRFNNILPYDQNRVKVGIKGFPRDYINASYIPFTHNVDKVEYIASQNPIDDSIRQFWQMIWEQNINCIINLAGTIDGDKVRCVQYWPKNVFKSLPLGNKSQLKIDLLKEDEKESHIERRLEVENTKINEKRQITQIHMTTWPDQSAPNLDHFDKMLFRFHEITSKNANPPYLVHCSAGVGSTGTLICIDRIIKELKNGSKEIDIYNQILNLRKYRNFMVQCPAQYVFIYDYINHFLSKSMKISDGEEPGYDE